MLAMNRLLWKRDVKEDKLQGLYISYLSCTEKNTEVPNQHILLVLLLSCNTITPGMML
jgi:hypothetical protein